MTVKPAVWKNAGIIGEVRFMYSNNRNGSRAGWARGFAALCAMLAMGLGAMASPAAAPFAYVANDGDGTVSVIDTATNMLVATVPVGVNPEWVAVTPDGKRAYVTNINPNTVSVIDTATNTVAATVSVEVFPNGVAVTPDGTHVYVANNGSDAVSVIDTATKTVVATVAVGIAPVGVAVTRMGNTPMSRITSTPGTVSVIATASNTVVATVPVGSLPRGVAVTPDGTRAYVANSFSNTVSVIATASNTVVATVPVGRFPFGGVAVTPDGTHVYVTNHDSDSVSVIDTVSNTVVATVPVGSFPFGVAVTPNGKHAYVPNGFDNNVSVIATATNTVVATVAVGSLPQGVGIVPPPPGIPFLAFGAVLNIAFAAAPNTDAFTLGTGFTLSSTAPVINPLTQPITLQIGTFAVTIPPGSFNETGKGIFSFEGVINGVTMKAVIKSTGTLRYNFQAGAQHASLTGTQNAVYVTLAIGGDSGATSVTAMIFH
jgi:YVTN family beta-propeller protein